MEMLVKKDTGKVSPHCLKKIVYLCKKEQKKSCLWPDLTHYSSARGGIAKKDQQQAPVAATVGSSEEELSKKPCLVKQVEAEKDENTDHRLTNGKNYSRYGQ